MRFLGLAISNFNNIKVPRVTRTQFLKFLWLRFKLNDPIRYASQFYFLIKPNSSMGLNFDFFTRIFATAGAQQERGGGARPNPPQRLTSSSPGLPHGPSPRAKGAQTQPGGQRGRAASVYSVSRVPIESCQRVCSGSRGAPRRSLCPSDTSDSLFPYVLYGTSKYWDGFNILYLLWKLVCC